jgi:hypothetical protein
MIQYREFITDLTKIGLDITYPNKVTEFLFSLPFYRAYKYELPIRGTALIQSLSILNEYGLIQISYKEINPDRGLDLVVKLTANGITWVERKMFSDAYGKELLVDEIYKYMTALGFKLFTPAKERGDYFKWIYTEANKNYYLNLTGITSIDEIASKMLIKQDTDLNKKARETFKELVNKYKLADTDKVIPHTFIDNIHDIMYRFGFSVHGEGKTWEFIKRGKPGQVLYVDLRGISSITEVSERMLKQQVMIIDQLLPVGTALSTHAPPKGAFAVPPKTSLDDVMNG